MSAAPPPKKPPSSLKKEFLVFFGSVKLAIALLLLVAGASVIGTVLPQDQGPAVVTESAFHPALKQVLLTIKAYDVYHAFWFNFLLALLFLNLAVCTYLRFPPTWRRYQMKTPPTPPVAGLQEAVPVASAPDALHLDMLRKRGYRVTALADGEYFAEKGKFVRLGPTFIHISLFAVIAGGILGGLTGMKNSLPLMVGETIGSDEVYKTAYVRGGLSPALAPFKLKLDNFRMDFRPNGMVKQYYSDITVTPDKGAPYTKKIWVNEPLIHEGVYFYQSFWGIGGLTYQVGDGPAEKMQLTQAKSGGYISRPVTVGGRDHVFFVREIQQPALLVDVQKLEPVAQMLPGTPVAVNGQLVGIKEYHLYSGLETKRDPGIPIVYFGCGAMIFGLAMVGVSHREVWLRRTEGGWVLAGRTHKGRVMLRKELEAIASVWPTPGQAQHAPDSPASPDLGAQAS